MRHPCVPKTYTIENLAKWITENAVEVREHEVKEKLTPEMITKLEHKSSLASRKLDELTKIDKQFKDILKNGTADEKTPADIQIPPTKGTKALKANREKADAELLQGYHSEITKLYLIPYPEESKLVAVDIEGTEMEQYSKGMTTAQINQYAPLLLNDAPKKKGKRGKKR